MFYYEGQSCPVCGKAFTESDDIVSCPECGAPHHRACWMQEGHCHFADKHGTDEQWTRPTVDEEEEKTQPANEESAPEQEEEGHRCPHCGKNNPTYAEFCSRCGRSLVEQDWTPPPPQQTGAAYTPFHAHTADQTGSLPRDTELDEDVTAGEAALAVGTNQMYYLPRFERMHREHRYVSWNWVAFLFPAPWLFYRKAYAAGAVVLAVQVVIAVLTTLLMLPFTEQYHLLMQNLMQGTISAQQFAAQYSALTATADMPTSVLLLDMLDTAITVGMGLFGNYVYRCSVMDRCRKLKSLFPSDYEARLPIEGGVSAALFVLAIAISQFLPSILLMWFI